MFSIPPTVIQETEPNDIFSLAQTLPILPVSVYGAHDGATDTGDVYQIELKAGEIVHVTLTTENPTGVQLLAYSGEAPTEIVRDFEAPFELTFLAIATGIYSLYVFTPGEVNNTGAYTLSVALTETPDANVKAHPAHFWLDWATLLPGDPARRRAGAGHWRYRRAAFRSVFRTGWERTARRSPTGLGQLCERQPGPSRKPLPGLAF